MEGVSVETTDSGRLAVVSDAVGLCYWPELSEATDLGNGRFVIGDFGAVIDGRVRLTGRSGDVINVAGRKLAPEEVEHVLGADASVQHCVVFGIPSEDSSRGDEVVACLCPSEGFDLDEFRKRAVKALRSWQVPRRWWVEPELAPDVRGKLSRALWRERFLTSSATSN